MKGLDPNWRLFYKIKCKSTENELSNWLKSSGIKKNKPIAIIANEQSAGIGQNSKSWLSPRGGIWISAAYPIFSKKFPSKIFSLSFAIKLCEMLWEENIEVDLKWPNDIFFDSKKLIGFLPRVITRGDEIIYVRIGLGMNIVNKTPSGAISLKKILKIRKFDQSYWTAKILKAFHDAVDCGEKKSYVIQTANKYLTKNFLPSGYSSYEWKIKHIDNKGNLVIFNQNKEKVVLRF